ncbi:MAG: N-succinylarginine dihydrolase [Pseudomonadota bacterium]|nr:N-succinylarginine dihydrolase [Pseudomonadota bacterium]
MVADTIREVIFIGLPGPTHHYGGLSQDNVASSKNRGSVSSPRQAALQALELARLLKNLGIEAAILPPQLRPHLPLLREHFSGGDDEVIRRAARERPEMLEKASSSSAMWTANAATVTPVIDAGDHKLHLTPANLFTHPHRRIEAEETRRTLAAIFGDVPDCTVHAPLLTQQRDEGAANHMLLAPTHSDSGLHVFVYGAGGAPDDPDMARQDLSASRAIQLQHSIPDRQALFVRQNPEVIHQGAFHNDVIAVSNAYVLLVHEHAYAGGQEDIGRMREAYRALHPGKTLTVITVSEAELSVEEAVHTYVFNSQIVTRPNGGMAIIAPLETQSLYGGKAARLLERIRIDASNPIEEVHALDLRQSMKNGGGPACLRLRVPVTEAQLAVLHARRHVLADETLLAAIAELVERYYPQELTAADLGNPELYHHCQAMLTELGGLMKLPLLAE